MSKGYGANDITVFNYFSWDKLPIKNDSSKMSTMGCKTALLY